MNRPIKPDNIPIMLTITEAHDTYRLSKQFLYSLAKSGKIKAVRAGKRFLLNGASITEYLNTATLAKDSEPNSVGIRRIDG